MAVASAVALRVAVANFRPMIADEKVASAAGTQASAAKIYTGFTRVIKGGGAGSSVVLPNLISNEAGADIYFVANSSGATIAVFCALGDTLNGSSNGSLTVADGGFGTFVKRPRQSFPYVAPDWAAGAVT